MDTFIDDSLNIHQINANVHKLESFVQSPVVITGDIPTKTNLINDDPIIIRQHMYTLTVEKQVYTNELSKKDHLIFLGCLNQEKSFYILTRNEAGYDGHIISHDQQPQFTI